MFMKLLILCLLTVVNCYYINEKIKRDLGRDECKSDSDCNNGYYCKQIPCDENGFNNNGDYIGTCGFCSGKGL